MLCNIKFWTIIEKNQEFCRYRSFIPEGIILKISFGLKHNSVLEIVFNKVRSSSFSFISVFLPSPNNSRQPKQSLLDLWRW